MVGRTDQVTTFGGARPPGSDRSVTFGSMAPELPLGDDPDRGIPSPQERSWRHPSEFGLHTQPGTTHPTQPRRHLPLTNLAGICVAGLVVCVAGWWLTLPNPDGVRRISFGGVNISISTTTADMSTTTSTAPVSLAAAASPLRRPTVSWDARPVSIDTSGRLHVDVADFDHDGDGRNDGALVVTVDPTGPGGLAGLEPGDVIIGVGAVDVCDGDDLPEALSNTQPGQVVDLEIRRRDHHLVLTASLAA